jgi:hypothetical protein
MSFAGYGNGVEKYIVCRTGLEFRHHTKVPIRARAKMLAVSQAIFSFDLDVTPGCTGTAVCPPLSAIHFSSLAKSLALCQRSSGDLARHFMME